MMESCITDIVKNGIPDAWNNPLTMQSMYSLADKGFTKKVSWKIGAFGLGLFAEERILKGEVYRKYVDGKNMMVFHSEADIPPLTNSTKKYLSNYLFQTEDICAICIPGDSINHGDIDQANTMGAKFADSNEIGLLGIATKDIDIGEELLLNYKDFGNPPDWLRDFARDRCILEYMPFKGYNNFV